MKNFYHPATSLVCAHLARLPRRSLVTWALVTVGFTIPFAATAQSADRDPLNAQTKSPPVMYDSAFTDYKPFQDPELMSWKTANDVVREFGSMAAMGDMSDDAKTTGNTETASEVDRPSPPAQPAHDMSKMAPQAPATASQKPAAPAGKPTAPASMPGMSH